MGITYSDLSQVFPPPAEFSAEAVPDLSGKVALVTGGTAGIGKETAKVLLTKNAKVWIACRTMSKGEATARELKKLTGRDAYLLNLDLSNLSSVKQAVDEFLRRESELHILFNNAGVLCPPVDMVTDDGYDLQFGTNVLGHFYLTNLLLHILISTAKSSPEGTVRVVNTASQGHILANLRFDTFKDGPKRRADHPFRLYAQSKTGNIVFSAELHRRFHDQGIVSTALHPGLIRSEISRHCHFVMQWLGARILWPVSYGALSLLYAGTAPEGAKLGGQYLIPWARVGKPRAYTQDPQLGKELWTWLEEQVARV